jgi:methylmalonyl-CoA/ethylmalonyl-CoA epimerase
MSATTIFEQITQGTLAQTAYVTNNLDAAMRNYAALLGGPKWTVWHVEDVEQASYRGKSAEFTFDMALAQFGGMMLELIQPIAGESTYSEALVGAPENAILAHHMGFDVLDLSNYRDIRDELIAAGCAVVQSGYFGANEFVYLDTRQELGVFLELQWMDAPTRTGFDKIQAGIVD